MTDSSDSTELEQPNELTVAMFGHSFGAVNEFAQMLAFEGELRGLIGPRERSRLWSRHIVNSAALLPFLPRKGSVIDVGSGAGLPGIVLAASRPNLQFFLVEPMERRCEWLAEAVEGLGLDNVEIVNARAEELGRRLRADAVTARAVASLDKLIRVTSKLIAPGGRLLALKGQRAQLEIEKASKELKKYHLTAQVHEVVSVMDGDSTYVVECKRLPR